MAGSKPPSVGEQVGPDEHQPRRERRTRRAPRRAAPGRARPRSTGPVVTPPLSSAEPDLAAGASGIVPLDELRARRWRRSTGTPPRRAAGWRRGQGPRRRGRTRRCDAPSTDAQDLVGRRREPVDRPSDRRTKAPGAACGDPRRDVGGTDVDHQDRQVRVVLRRRAQPAPPRTTGPGSRRDHDCDDGRGSARAPVRPSRTRLPRRQDRRGRENRCPPWRAEATCPNGAWERACNCYANDVVWQACSI